MHSLITIIHLGIIVVAMSSGGVSTRPENSNAKTQSGKQNMSSGGLSTRPENSNGKAQSGKQNMSSGGLSTRPETSNAKTQSGKQNMSSGGVSTRPETSNGKTQSGKQNMSSGGVSTRPETSNAKAQSGKQNMSSGGVSTRPETSNAKAQSGKQNMSSGGLSTRPETSNAKAQSGKQNMSSGGLSTRPETSNAKAQSGKQNMSSGGLSTRPETSNAKAQSGKQNMSSGGLSTRPENSNGKAQSGKQNMSSGELSTRPENSNAKAQSGKQNMSSGGLSTRPENSNGKAQSGKQNVYFLSGAQNRNTPPQHSDEQDTPPQHSDEQDTPPQHSDEQDTPPQHSDEQDTPPQHSDEQDTPPQHSDEQDTPPQHSDEQDTPPQHSDEQDTPPQHSDELDTPPQHSDEQDTPPQHSNEQDTPPQHSDEQDTRSILSGDNKMSRFLSRTENTTSMLADEQNFSIGIPACNYRQLRITRYPSSYALHGEDIPTFAVVFKINDTNSECFLNSRDIIQAYNFPTNESLVAFFAFKCENPVHIMFDNSKELINTFPNVIGYLQVLGCILDESINQFSQIVDMKILTFRPNTDISMVAPRNSRKCIMDKAVSLLIDGIMSWNETDTFNILEYKDMFLEMKEVALSNLALLELPQHIKHKFPNLQSLEMPKNNLTLPPSDFPWNDNISVLPLNLSRSEYFQDQYSHSRHIDIPANIYRRIFNLNNNNIQNLTDFRFHGYLHMISLDSNNLRYLDEFCFRYVTGLQNIQMSNNRLSSLPAHVFMGLSSLRHLNMQSNFLGDLSQILFEDLTNLIYLNLASNNISFLRVGLFTNLLNLQELVLDKNKLVSFDELSLPLHSISLKYIRLNDNPLLELPIVTFYMRSLRRIELQNTDITLGNLAGLITTLNPSLFVKSIVQSSSDSQFNLLKRPIQMKEIDLTGSKVQVLNPGTHLDDISTVTLLALFIHYHIKLDKNPLMCDCNIIPILHFIDKYTANGTYNRNDYFFKEWTCVAPDKFAGKQLLEIAEEDTYCTTNVSNCPENCVCNLRTMSHIIIVDCRNSGLKTLPSHLPEGLLDLWFQNNNITRIEPRNYLRRVRTLSISDNDIERVDRNAILQLSNILSLQLSSNNLIGLPQEMEYLRLQDLTIGDNPFSCDCHSLWLKSWIERNKDVVKDSASVTCNTQIGTARPILKVPHSEFVCKLDFDVTKHVIIPATASAITVCVVVILTVVVGIYRLEVKVFLYIYLGVRPFDKNKKLQQKPIDVFIVHSPQTQEWVTENVLSANETSATKIVDICTDLVAGFSLFENIACLMDQTRKVIFVLSIDFLPDDKLQMAWLEAMKKIADNGVGFIQFITDGVTVKDINDPGMCKVMKHTRCLKTNEHFIKNKISYLIGRDKYANKRQTSDLRYLLQRNNNANCQIPEVDCSNIFLDYSEHTRPFVVNSLYPHLKAEGYDVFLPDKDFIPGVPKDENILKYVTSACHTVLAVSKSHFDDEWSLFTFREALQKSRREKYNHLIVVTTGDIEPRVDQDEELGHYLKSHVILQADDEHFFRNLKRSLRSPLDTTDPCRQVEKSAGDRIIYNHIVNNGDIVLEL